MSMRLSFYFLPKIYKCVSNPPSNMLNSKFQLALQGQRAEKVAFAAFIKQKSLNLFFS